MVTITDVARRAGVSTSTVSRVINGKQVTANRAEAVQRAVAALDFTPNGTARSLRRRRSTLVALVLPELTDPLLLAIARGADDTAHGAAHALVLCTSDGDPEREVELVRTAARENMAGIILVPVETGEDAAAAAGERPLVIIDRSAASAPATARAIGARAAAEVLG